jgi:hypothetical protein
MERVEWSGQFFHTDIYKPIQVPSYNSLQYILIIIDNASHTPILYFLKLKSNTKTIIKTFIKRVNNNHLTASKRV